MVFMQPQRLVVPLFQRPYVWNKENQWEPLWDDVIRVAERELKGGSKQQPHFLGAVVLQQVAQLTGLMQQRTIIDGQQRLTTLQLLLDALRRELLDLGAVAPAARIEALVENAVPFRAHPEDRFKVWPTNRDRAAFNRAMGASDVPGPIAEDPNERIAEAHSFFREQARAWLSEGPESAEARAAAIEKTVRDLLQLVVIDLNADENAQEIFETLNARGAQLTAADLIKNLVFQRLSEDKADVESVYRTHWRDFETAFWETYVSSGRTNQHRSSIFLNHWLVAVTGEEVVAREVFDRFKRFAAHQAGISMEQLVAKIYRAAQVYRKFVEASAPQPGAVDRLGLFSYRTGVMESEVVKPLTLHLLDPELPPISPPQFEKALQVVESWMVRRMLVRATSKGNNQTIAEIVALLRRSDRQAAGDVIESFLAGQTSGSRYWPDDAEVRAQLETLVAYRVVGRGRLRMLLEAIEDHQRGWRDGKQGLGGERVARGAFAIEHIMPRKWETHWPTEPEVAQHRNRLVHTIGNLTLLTGKLNSKLSNGPWLGENGKRAVLAKHDVLILNRNVCHAGESAWTDDMIRRRSLEMAEAIVQIWPAPENHRTEFGTAPVRVRRKLTVLDLMSAGVLAAGMRLVPRLKQYRHLNAVLLEDGRIDVGGTVYQSVSQAASAIRGHSTNGWWFFLGDPAEGRSLGGMRRDYLEMIAPEADDDEEDDVEADDDEG
jgi:hypothetical protein